MAECLHISQNRKDDSNSDTEDDDYERFCKNFTYSQTTTCCVCNGYYSPSFGEPLCNVCHAFLVPVEVIEGKRSTDLSDNDEDSGNDEPPYRELVAPIERALRPIDVVRTPSPPRAEDIPDEDIPVVNEQIEPVASTSKTNDRIAMYENAFLSDRPEPEPPRNLKQYLTALTEMHESIPNNHVHIQHHESRPVNSKTVKLLATTSSASKGKLGDTISELPVEVLIVIFSYLDDISLCNSSEVCKQWKNIIETHTPQSLWERYTKTRWPLYHQITRANNWFKIYSSMMSSCFCRTCVILSHLRTPNQRENRFRATRLRGDVRYLTVDATEGVEAVPLDDQLTRWQASILGPPGSPYEGGKFFLHIQIPYNYPMNPPVVRFLTKIIHPNVSRHGDVGIDIIQHNWSLVLTISKLLLSVQSLLTDPFTEVCMEPVLGQLYDQDRPRFEALARRWTWKYSMFEVIP